MARITVNFADVDEFVLVEKGTYAAEVSAAEVKWKEDGEYPYIDWTWEITDGEFAGSKIPRNNTSLSPKALFRLLPVLQAIGVIDDDFDLETDDLPIEYDEDTGVILEPDLIGLSALVVIGHDNYQGRKIAKVVDVLPFDEDEPAPKPKVKAASKPAARPAKQEDVDEGEEEEEAEEQTSAAKKKASPPKDRTSARNQNQRRVRLR